MTQSHRNIERRLDSLEDNGTDLPTASIAMLLSYGYEVIDRERYIVEINGDRYQATYLADYPEVGL